MKTKTKAMERGARFSLDGKYRHLLWRIWDRSKGLVCYVGLNPSVADGIEDDNTITRLLSFTRDNGYGGFYIVNLFAEINTDFKHLKKSESPNSYKDNYFIARYAMKAKSVCLMWGNNGSYQKRSHKVLSLLANLNLLGKLYAFNITKKLQPGHPLYLPSGTTFKRVVAVLPDGNVNMTEL